jgi:hypothetical protein
MRDFSAPLRSNKNFAERAIFGIERRKDLP